MGSRGAHSGLGGKVGNPRSDAYKEEYRAEISNIDDFAARSMLDGGMTNDNIGYEMYVYQSVMGESLIAHTQSEITSLKTAYREAVEVGRSYGMTDDEIGGMRAGIKAKIDLQEKAVAKMQGARAEYEKYKKQASIGNEKAKRRKGKWM